MSAVRASHWAGIGEGTFVRGISFLCGVHRWLGRWPFRLCLYPVVLGYWLGSATARGASREYLQRVQAHARAKGEQIFAREPGLALGIQHFLRFGETLLDKLLATGGRYPAQRVQLERRVMLEQLARGEGGVILTAHVGCLELCQALSESVSGLKLSVLVHTAHAEKFNRMLRALNPDARIQLLQVTEIDPSTAMRISERIAAGEFVAMVGDRVPVDSGRCTWASFLGHRAPFPIGAYVLAAAIGCPVFTMTCIPGGHGYTVAFDRFAERIVLPRATRETALAGYAAQYSVWLEQQVRQAPLDWFNFFYFWDQPHHDRSN